MAVLPPKGRTVTRRPTFKGVMMQDVSNGAERSRAWPRKRGKITNPVTLEQMEWFRQAQWATKYMDPKMLQTFVRATQGTPLLPRDLATMMFAGRFLSFTMDDGKKIYSMATVNDVSESLDVLGQTAGMTLQRGVDRWEAIPPIIANRAGVTLTRAANLSCPLASNQYTVPWTTEVIDQALFWNIAAPNDIVIPVAGWYSVLFDATKNVSSQQIGRVHIFKNGVQENIVIAGSGNVAAAVTLQVSALLYCAAGDIITAKVSSPSNTQTYSAFKISVVGNA